jgi:Flp pilus assembly secretin CpaC
MENVGLMLGVTPGIRRDGLIVMQIDIERSQLGPAEEGTPTSKPSDGAAIRVPPTETLSAQTTVSARNGQSVLVGAERTERQARQSELLIVVTPELINSEPPAAGEMTPHVPTTRGR